MSDLNDLNDLNDKVEREFEECAISQCKAYRSEKHGVVFYDAGTKQAAWWAWQAARATPTPQAAPSDEMTARVDAAMTAMRGISPPLRRSECEQLIRAALAASPAVTQAATSEPVTTLYARQFDLDTRGMGKAVLTYAAPDGDWSVPLYAAPVAAPLPSSDARDVELADLLTRIDEAFTNYERMGAVCEFEGQPMIYASTLEEIAALAAATQSTEKP